MIYTSVWLEAKWLSVRLWTKWLWVQVPFKHCHESFCRLFILLQPFAGLSRNPELGMHEPELGSSNQEASPSAGKNAGVVLVPCLCMQVHLYSYFQWCGYFWGPLLPFVMADVFSLRVIRDYFRNWGQRPKDTKKEHFFTTKKLKRAPLIWPPPMFIASLQLF